MTLTELQSLIGDLTNDPNHDRYSLSSINTELDNTQDAWNIKAKIIKDTVTITTADGTRQYAISNLTGTPISFPRVTHKGLDLDKRSKAWLDHFNGTDWTATGGTPKYFIIEQSDPDVQFIDLWPTPQAADAGANLVVEYIKRHTSMSASSDVPFMSGTVSNAILRPYDWGLAYDVAGRLLARDPSIINVPKSQSYAKISQNVLDDVYQVFKAMEEDEPARIGGGRYWKSGYIRKPK